MEWTDSALVLHVGKFREADLWVRLLARHRGLVTAFAFGGSKSRRRFAGCLDTLNFLKVHVTSSRNGLFLNLQEAQLLEGPTRLRGDWKRQGMAANCLRFVEAMGVAPEEAPPVLEVLLDVQRLMEQADTLPEALPLFFRFRLASVQGYAPDLNSCGMCGEPLETPEICDAEGRFTGLHTPAAWFLVSEGLAVCPACAAKSGGSTGLALNAEAVQALRLAQEAPPLAWGVPFAPESVRQCTRMIDAFVRYHLGLEWQGGRFRRN